MTNDIHKSTKKIISFHETRLIPVSFIEESAPGENVPNEKNNPLLKISFIHGKLRIVYLFKKNVNRIVIRIMR